MVQNFAHLAYITNCTFIFNFLIRTVNIKLLDLRTLSESTASMYLRGTEAESTTSEIYQVVFTVALEEVMYGQWWR